MQTLKKVRTLLRMTFKGLTLLPSNTENKVIDRLMKYNIDERAAYMVEKNSIKWDARKERKAPEYKRMRSKRPEGANRDPIPKELQEYISLQSALCPICLKHGIRVVTSHSHVAGHNLYIPSSLDLIDEISQLNVCKKGKMCRNETLKLKKDHIIPHIRRIKEFLNRSLICI